MLTFTCHAGSLMVFCGNPSQWRPNAPFLSIKLVKTARLVSLIFFATN